MRIQNMAQKTIRKSSVVLCLLMLLASNGLVFELIQVCLVAVF